MPSNPLSIGFDVPFDEAIAAALARGVVLPSVYYQQLQGLARQLAFSIAGIASITQLRAVLDALSTAMRTGQSFTEWLDEAAVMNLNLPQHRLDNIWRTNLQGNYMRGKWEQFLENKDNRPYLQYDAINDSRVRPTHLAMDGVIRRWDDPFWKTHSPPNGYRCVMPWTKVRGDFEIGLKSWYSGKAVEIKTESGSVLAVTANHPILTDRGWICAHQVKDGDNVLRHNFVTDYFSHGIVDNNNPPASADDVFKALSLEALGLIDISSFEFHDDANMRERDVYVAGADSVLMNGFVPLLPDSLQKRTFIHPTPGPLSDAIVTEKSIKEAPTDFFSFQHFHDRFTGQVFVDKVLSIRDFTFSGHVYDFQCKNGVVVAEDIITHNCRCSLFSLTEAQARARTGVDKEGRGTGLNKEPVNPDGSPAMPDKGWDYHPYEDQVGVLRKVLFDMKDAAGPVLGAAISELISELDSLGDESV